MNHQFWKSFDVVNDIADEIGIDRAICQTALTEVLVSYLIIEENRKKFINQGNSTQDTTKELCNLYFNDIFKGVHFIWEKYPSESILVKTKMILIDFANANHLEITPTPKTDRPSSNSEVLNASLLNEQAGWVQNMFKAIKLRMFIAKIQAELMAQYKDQNFVNRVCQNPIIIKDLIQIKDNACYKQGKIAPFLHVCFILGEAIESDVLTQEEKDICATLLAQRLDKVSQDPEFRLRNIMIFGDLEEKLNQYQKKFL